MLARIERIIAQIECIHLFWWTECICLINPINSYVQPLHTKTQTFAPASVLCSAPTPTWLSVHLTLWSWFPLARQVVTDQRILRSAGGAVLLSSARVLGAVSWSLRIRPRPPWRPHVTRPLCPHREITRTGDTISLLRRKYWTSDIH